MSACASGACCANMRLSVQHEPCFFTTTRPPTSASCAPDHCVPLVLCCVVLCCCAVPQQVGFAAIKAAPYFMISSYGPEVVSVLVRHMHTCAESSAHPTAIRLTCWLQSTHSPSRGIVLARDTPPHPHPLPGALYPRQVPPDGDFAAEADGPQGRGGQEEGSAQAGVCERVRVCVCVYVRVLVVMQG
jgi:hypothetical protein